MKGTRHTPPININDGSLLTHQWFSWKSSQAVNKILVSYVCCVRRRKYVYSCWGHWPELSLEDIIWQTKETCISLSLYPCNHTASKHHLQGQIFFQLAASCCVACPISAWINQLWQMINFNSIIIFTLLQRATISGAQPVFRLWTFLGNPPDPYA